jgi:hypothetical protein
MVKLENKRGRNVQGRIILSDSNILVLIVRVLFQETLGGKNTNISPLLFNF